MTRKVLFVFVLWVALTGAIRADVYDDLVRAEMEQQKIPGVAIAILKGGKPLKVQGYGLANLEHNVLVTPDTVFQLGSVGKQFTAGLVVLLAQEGKLSLEDSIGKHLTFAPPGWKAITVRHLLTHTSGLPDYTGLIDLTRDATAEATAKIVAEKPVDFAPGEKWAYSNTNYLLLGVLIEKVTGRFYGDLLTEKIFRPLGMTTARINSEADIILNRAAGYVPDKEGVRNQPHVAPTVNTYADGSVVMSLRDFVRWDAALDTETLFSKSQREQMWTPAKLNGDKATQYGLGWVVNEVNGRKVVEHGGAWQGFTAHISRYLDDKISVLVLINRAGTNPLRLTRALAAAARKGSVADATPETSLSTEEQDPKIVALVRDLLKEVAENKVRLTRFTPEMQSLLKPPESNTLARDVQALGEPRAITVVGKRENGNVTFYRVRVTFATSTAIVLLRINPDGKIATFGLTPEE